ncbi:MAG: trypsin-like peptidase domain-containing protein [Flavobacteriales bacterium]|nr:trypsin-like peptidase domain-containing protein [Flavobacteriales bacterium]
MNVQKALGLFLVAVLGGVSAVGAFVWLSDKEQPQIVERIVEVPPVSMTNYAAAVSGNLDFTVAAEKTVNAVVHVKTEVSMEPVYNPWFEMFGYEMEPQVQQGTGSGVIISPNGYIVTNNHVVQGAQSIEVSLNNNATYTAEVIGTDPSTDIALIKIDAADLPTVGFGNSDQVKVGEWVLAVGNPFDLTSTVTAGIVSAKARNINILRSDNENGVFPIESFIQTDAAVNPGNSGGALVNTQGELIGINTAIASRTGSYSGYSFAVPVSIVEKVTRDLMEFGHVQRAFIGVHITEMTQDIAREIGMSDASGVYVSHLVNEGAAEQAGVEVGDVILSVGNKSVATVPELQEQVSRFRPGDQVNVKVWRSGNVKDINMVLRNRSGRAELEDFSVAAVNDLLGASFADVSDTERARLKISGGAKVSELGQGKLKKSGVEPNFIITKVDGRRIETPKDLENALRNKNGGVLIEGVYPNGTKAYYGFGL